ncbi:MAG: phosphatase [Planctomycetaceae bacterium]|nr:phosphatase [Planctomycetaceae bacterium]|tara:strand:+ start:281 stop:1600 length:1320 start_codon:yes stop_codon:yes gene_type:complete
MVQIEAFQGLRYDLAHVGSLSDVIAPPYDVIDPELQKQLYQAHPANVIRLILNREEPGDDSGEEKYERAARALKQWQRDGVLSTESHASVYVYHQEFTYAGSKFVRKGFMCRMQLEKLGEGNVYPHEETHSAAKVDRLKLFNATKANLSQIFGIYQDEDNQAQAILERVILGKTPLEATDHLGVIHRLWVVDDLRTIIELQLSMSDKAIFIADGHHRYETACNYQQQILDSGQLTDTHPANYVMTMCVSMNDEGMIVLPTHRLFKGLSAYDSATLISKIESDFDTRIAGTGVGLAESVWEQISLQDAQDTIGLYCPVDETWVIATLNINGLEKLASVANDRTDDWQGLGVSILHRLLVETSLGCQSLPKPKYVHLITEVVDSLNAGTDDDGEVFGLAALVMPATLEHIRNISKNGERMPAKSTYFYPKLVSGLVINSLE